jgi:hypothetical protein
MTKNIDNGFICECGKKIKYSGYVYAHMNVELIHSCKDCGRKHSILEGIAELDYKETWKAFDEESNVGNA